MFASFLEMLDRARKHQPLTPSERALLKLWWSSLLSLGITAFWSAVQAVIVFLSQNTTYNWPSVLLVAGAGAAFAIGTSVMKWVSAHQDTPLGMGLGVLAQFFLNHLAHLPPQVLANTNWQEASNFILNMMHGLYLTNQKPAVTPVVVPAPQSAIQIAPAEPAPVLAGLEFAG
jgi:hypothetical protein